MTAEPDEETLDRMRRAVAKLKPIEREVFLRCAADGLTYAQVGKRLGISAEKVQRHLADALYNLDRLMERAERPWWRFW